VPDAQDNCADTPPGETVDSSGCPADTTDADKDGVPDAHDLCDETPAGANVSRSGCPLAFARIMGASRCSGPELDRALDVATRELQGQRPRCTSLIDLANGLPGGDSKDPEKRTKAILSVLRSTRTRSAGSGKRREPLGVAVTFDLTLEGFKGRKVEVRWSLYRGGGRVATPWLKDHPVLSVKGEADVDRASPEFWVPLPKQRARYFVAIEVFDDKGTKLTRKKTTPFR
jgi:hypothetical protein